MQKIWECALGARGSILISGYLLLYTYLWCITTPFQY